MTTTGGETLFLDTNVLIYATDPRSPLGAMDAVLMRSAWPLTPDP